MKPLTQLSLDYSTASSVQPKYRCNSEHDSCTASFNLSDTLQNFENLTKLAKLRDGTQLVVFPEAFIGGYPQMPAFGCVVGDRSAEGRDEFLRYHKSAIEIPSPAISHIEAVSKETGVFVVIVEREGGTLCCTVIFVDPVEELVGKHGHREIDPGDGGWYWRKRSHRPGPK